MAGLPPGSGTALLLSALVVVTVGFGLIADLAGLGLGTPLPPFFATWEPSVGPGALPWLIVLVVATAGAVPLARGAGGPLAFALAASALGLVARLALAASREGVDGWYSVFGSDPEAANEYLPALPALDLGLGAFLDRFAQLAPSLPIHPSAHPPGTLLLLDGLGIDGARGMAALVIAVGIAAVPLTYLGALRLGMEEWRARAAALLLAFSPASMLYGVSSADALFATLGIAAVVLLVAGGAVSRIAGALTLAIASFFSWALLAVAAFSALVVWRREGLGKAIRVAAGSGLALLAFYGVLYAISGYDPIGVVSSANEAYDLGISNARPWAYWVLGSPAAFLVAAGLPILWYGGRALGTGETVAVALAAVIAIAALLGFSKAETERIWLFFVPLACLAAAAVVPRERVPLLLGLLVAQAVVVELTLDTVW